MKVPDAFWVEHGLDKGGRYILYVGSEDPRKNLPTLIQAFAQVKKYMPGVKLLKVGAAYFDGERRKLRDRITRMNLQRDILFFDYVTEQDLRCFYNAAEVLVLPSFYEGFGLPIVEAMACGTPVVGSTAGSLPEVIGDAGIQVDPWNSQAIAEAILTILDNHDKKSMLRQAGLQQITKFSIEQSACETMKVYSKTMNAGLSRKKVLHSISS
jgi:glycosyltransferase involved in cell wall biosynthesis